MFRCFSGNSRLLEKLDKLVLDDRGSLLRIYVVWLDFESL